MFLNLTCRFIKLGKVVIVAKLIRKVIHIHLSELALVLVVAAEDELEAFEKVLEQDVD